MRNLGTLLQEWSHKSWGILLCLGLLTYIIYHLIQGDRGIRSWIILRQELQLKQNELAALNQEQNRLERDIFLLRDEHLDPELLGEYVLKVLHYAPPHDWMILVPEESLSSHQKENP